MRVSGRVRRWLKLALLCVASGYVGYAFGHWMQADLVTGGLIALLWLVALVIVGLRWMRQNETDDPR